MEYNYLQLAFLGVIQGITEFIPVSSSGHLEIVPRLFGWDTPPTNFILFVHIGTLLALLIYFYPRIFSLLKTAWDLIRRSPVQNKSNISILSNLILAILPAAVLGLLVNKGLSKFYENDENSLLIVLVTLSAMAGIGILFILSDRIFTGKKFELSKLSKKKAVFIGLLQVAAFLRGVSRSGITLVAGQSVGLQRAAAAEFSFLISIPIITGTSILAIYDVISLPVDQLQEQLVGGLVGLVAAYISGYISIGFLLNYLKQNNLRIFGWYRIAFAIISLIILIS